VANIKSQIKRNKQNESRRKRNRVFRGAARTAIKAARAEMTDVEVKTAVSAIDKAAEKGAIHPRNAARRKSRLMKAANKAAKAPASETAAKKK
jgi:small subunit ribosomal protein S20